MATALEHAETVFSGILPHRKDLLDVAMRRLATEHFEDSKQSTFFRMLSVYADSVNSVLPRKYLDDMLASKVDEAQYTSYLEMYDFYTENEVNDSDFYFSVDQLRDNAAKKATGEAIVAAMEILQKGKEIKPGLVLRGHADARERLIDTISVIDRDLSSADAPEGFIQDEYESIMGEYEANKAKYASGEVQGIGFGIDQLDSVTGGMQNGDLAIVAASSSHGKSSLAAQSAWYAATQQGKNTTFFATETARAIIRRKIIARHSKLEMFELPDGLNTRNLKEGTLNEKEERVLKAVVHDLTTNTDYGKLHIAQVPRGATVATIEHKINRIARNDGCDYAVIDYAALLSSTERVSEDRNKYVNILRELKLVAPSVAEGVGIPILTPWQISRDGRVRAENTGYYTMNDLSDTSEAEKIADVIVSLFRADEESGRFVEGNVQILKMRDGEKARDILIDIDYGTCTFQSSAAVGNLSKSSGQGNASWSLDSLYSGA